LEAVLIINFDFWLIVILVFVLEPSAAGEDKGDDEHEDDFGT
jgi:hypothetical protein